MKKRTIVLFLFLILCFLGAISRLEDRRLDQGKQQLENALRQAAVSCYAAEGFYPADVAYLQEHYGLQYDENTYVVHYTLIASNWMPDITVLEKSP